mgnify:CR=1 FL=1
MKSIWICIVLSFLIIVLIVVPHIFITNTTHEIRELLKSADSAVEAEDWQQAVKLCKDTSQRWEKYTPLYEMIVEHQEVDEIIMSIRQLERFAAEKEKPEARALISELDFLINHLRETDNLSIENIF